jgi:2-polyprenyl-3-methyl-5-hydroxy-6-metoxy-1,4-benzoquinol methylase
MPFNYDKIPKGYYDQIFNTGTPVRRLWHRLKFLRVISCLEKRPDQRILDIGCFAGSFLSLLEEEQFKEQIGIDMLPTQIDYANERYGTRYRRFVNGKVEDLVDSHRKSFDAITLIEVIEHLNHEEIRSLLSAAADLTKPGGRLILSTPNYLSAWPLIEIIINQLSDVSYEEQHITKFNYFNFAKKLGRIHQAFTSDFKLLNKTTTHFVAPFLAALNEDLAMKTASHWSPEAWSFPLGSMLLFTFERNRT